MRILLIAGLLAFGSTALAQPAPRRLSLVPDLRIDAKQLGLQRDPLVAIGPSGQVVATMRFGFLGIKAFDSTGKDLGWKLPTGHNDESEIWYPTAFGWIGGTNTLWVGDAGYKQVVLVNDQGKVTKSIENPSWVHPSWAERRKYPLFARMEPVAVYGDESMLIVPTRERSLINTPGYDRSRLHVLRTTWSGAIQRTVGLFPTENGRVFVSAKGCNHTIAVPMAARSYWAASVDGTHIVSVSPGGTRADSGVLRVVALNDRGDTVFARTYRQPVVPVPQSAIDAFLATIRPCGSVTAEQLRDSATKHVSIYKSMLLGVLAGRDHSTWVTMRVPSDTAEERIAMILDPRGEVVGTVTLPIDHTLVAADRDHLWALELGRIRAPVALVRFKVEATTAPPARSGRGAASSRPSPPPT
jgi:hypothetical protein